jgi:hypothetical protein
MGQGRFFELQVPTEEELKSYTPEHLYEVYKVFYDYQHEKYEQELAVMEEMLPENRDISSELFKTVKQALEIQEYRTAKSERNPHQYCLREFWKGDASFIQIAEIIRMYGYVEWFWKKPYMMLNIGEYQYWSMGWPLEVTVLINRAKILPCTKADLLTQRSIVDV